MARLYKCYGSCGEKYEQTSMIVHSNKRYCKTCLEKKIQDEEDRNELYSLIRFHYGVTFPTSLHLAQIKRCKDNGYSYNDMVIGMKFCLDVLHMKFTPSMGFGYVTNNIEAAKEHYKKQKEKQISNDNIFSDNIFESAKIVVTKPDNRNLFKESKMINLEDIL